MCSTFLVSGFARRTNAMTVCDALEVLSRSLLPHQMQQDITRLAQPGLKVGLPAGHEPDSCQAIPLQGARAPSSSSTKHQPLPSRAVMNERLG